MGVQLPNWSEAVVTYVAVALVGAIFVPRMMIYRQREMVDTMARTEAKVLVTTDEYRGFDHLAMAHAVAAQCDSIRHVINVGDGGGGSVRFEELCETATYNGAGSDPTDPHIILFSSGTTARPKGILHTFNTYAACARVLAGSEGFDVRVDDVCLMSSPIMHSTGLQAGVLVPLVAKAATVLQDVWNADEALGLIGDHRVTFSVGAPSFASMMIDSLDPSRHDISSFRLFACGGAPVPAPLVREVTDVLGCEMMTVFGQTEASVQTKTRARDPIDRVASSDGRAVPGMEVVILDDNGQELPHGEMGEICCRGATVMVCYLNDPEHTSEAFDHGWFHSGDLGIMDAAGYLRVTGRKKDLIIRGGHNIAPAEIEEILMEHPMVQQVAVIGYPDRQMGEKVCAVIVPLLGTSPGVEELQQFMLDRKVMIQLAPERVELRDALPLNSTGKVEKYKLREEIKIDVTGAGDNERRGRHDEHNRRGGRDPRVAS